MITCLGNATLILCSFYVDNHDIISMKFYETEIPVTATDGEDDVDRSRIVPVATGAEPYRGLKILMQWIQTFVCAAHEQNYIHIKGNFKLLKIIAF